MILEALTCEGLTCHPMRWSWVLRVLISSLGVAYSSEQILTLLIQFDQLISNTDYKEKILQVLQKCIHVLHGLTNKINKLQYWM